MSKICKILSILLLNIASLTVFSASESLPHFEEDVTVLKYEDPKGRVFRAERIDYTNKRHYEIAQLIDAESKTNPYWHTSLSYYFPQFFRESHKAHQAELMEAMQKVVNLTKQYPLQEYLLYDEVGEPIGTFGLSLPDGFSDFMNLKELDKARNDARRLDKEILEEDDEDYPSSMTTSFAQHAAISRYILQKHRGKRFGPVMSMMLRQLVDKLQGKSCPVLKFDRDNKFSITWTPVPLAGWKSDIDGGNMASLISHLAEPYDASYPEGLEVKYHPQDHAHPTLIYPPSPAHNPHPLIALKHKIIASRAVRAVTEGGDMGSMKTAATGGAASSK